MCTMSTEVGSFGSRDDNTPVIPSWTFADRLRKIRRDVAGLTQADFAATLELPKDRYANWEFGRGYPRNLLAVAKRIELAYSVPAKWTLGMEPEKTTPTREADETKTRVLIDALRDGALDEKTIAALLAAVLTQGDDHSGLEGTAAKSSFFSIPGDRRSVPPTARAALTRTVEGLGDVA